MGHVDSENPWDPEHAKGTIGKSVSGDPEVYLFYAKSKNISSTSAASCVLSGLSLTPVEGGCSAPGRRRPGTSSFQQRLPRPRTVTGHLVCRCVDVSHPRARRSATTTSPCSRSVYSSSHGRCARMLLAASLAQACLAVLAARPLQLHSLWRRSSHSNLTALLPCTPAACPFLNDLADPCAMPCSLAFCCCHLPCLRIR